MGGAGLLQGFSFSMQISGKIIAEKAAVPHRLDRPKLFMPRRTYADKIGVCKNVTKGAIVSALGQGDN